MKIFYFGCNRLFGHHMHAPDKSGVSDQETYAFIQGNPWGYAVDGGLCPDAFGAQIEGQAVLHSKDGWTAIAFWDRSIDHRHDSNSVFLAEGEHTFAEMVALATEHFPTVMGRFKFQIVDATPKGDPCSETS